MSVSLDSVLTTGAGLVGDSLGVPGLGTVATAVENVVNNILGGGTANKAFVPTNQNIMGIPTVWQNGVNWEFIPLYANSPHPVNGQSPLNAAVASWQHGNGGASKTWLASPFTGLDFYGTDCGVTVNSDGLFTQHTVVVAVPISNNSNSIIVNPVDGNNITASSVGAGSNTPNTPLINSTAPTVQATPAVITVASIENFLCSTTGEIVLGSVGVVGIFALCWHYWGHHLGVNKRP